ncbi:seminal metalloprotease 1-like [Anopheles funestus]|uniref:seminal metalloprotease 1-like n=1 Tax=Anopheles funestus TaxID=62324 RepID=UPI0020C738D9|nr:seminal metalloprotease 1-like [Anopheles funestus]
MLLGQSCAFIVLACTLVQAGIVKLSQENVSGQRNWQPNELEEEHSVQFEGDMMLRDEQLHSLMSNRRNALNNASCRWPGGIVPVSIDEKHFTSFQIKQILRAMRHIQSASCIKFVKRTDEYAFVNVTNVRPGCHAPVGYYPYPEILNVEPAPVGTGCFKLGTIVHLFLHMLCFVHQHTVSDRDEYVDILWDNIEPDMEMNFHKWAAGALVDFGVPYDYGSVMHYSATAYSKNGRKTIVPKDPNARIGQRKGLSEKDILKLNLFYNCANEK